MKLLYDDNMVCVQQFFLILSMKDNLNYRFCLSFVLEVIDFLYESTYNVKC